MAVLIATNPQAQHRSAVRSVTTSLLLALTALWCAYWFLHSRGYWEDDAYIHLEFARSFATGHGFAFNGVVVAGDTAPLWVLLLAATHTLIPNWLAAGKLLTALGALFGLSGTYAFARRLASSLLSASDAQVFSAAVVLLVAVNPYTCYWIFSGMEPIAAAGLACWAVLAATRASPSAQSFLVACLLTGLGPLLRPEMLLLAALLLLPLLHQWRRIPTAPGAKAALFVAGLLLLAGPLLLWSLYSLHAFGHLLPNTNAAKRAGAGQSILLRLLQVYALGLPVFVVALLAGVYGVLRLGSLRLGIWRSACSAFRDYSRPQLDSPLEDAPDFVSSQDDIVSSRQRVSVFPLAGWLFLAWAAITIFFYIANHTYVQSRYVLLTAPGLMAIVLALILFVWPRAGRGLFGCALIWSVAMSIGVVRPFLRNKEINCQTSRDMALFIRDRIPANAPVAVYSIGEIAFVSQHPIVDIGGITRPGAVPYLNAPPGDLLRWARSQGAQYDIADKPPEAGATSVFTIDAPFVGWTLHASRYSTAASVSLWKLPPSTQAATQASNPTSPRP